MFVGYLRRMGMLVMVVVEEIEDRGGACGRLRLMHLSKCIFVNLLPLDSEV